MTDRFQPPTGLADQAAQRSLSDVSRVFDSQPRLNFKIETATALSVAPGEIRRLAPRSGGQTVVLPAAAPSNAGQSVALFVVGLGTLTVTPVTGTINGASALAFAAGTYSLELFSDGTTWLTPGLADGSVTTAKLAALSVTTAKIAAGAVTNAKLADMAAARVKGQPVGASTGAPVDLTGLQVGELVRFDTRVIDTTSTGTIVTYTVAEATNVISFNSGVAATTLRGATVPGVSGKPIIWENFGTGVTVTFNHEDGSAAAAGERFRCPGSANFALTDGHRIITVYFGGRHRIVASA